MKKKEKRTISEEEMVEMLENGILKLIVAGRFPIHVVATALISSLVLYLADVVKPDDNGDKRPRIRQLIIRSMEICLSNRLINMEI